MPQTIYNVIVTAAGGEPEGNPSPAVRDALPPEITLEGDKTVRILKYPNDRLCSFLDMRQSTVEIWSNDPVVFGMPWLPRRGFHVDLVLHIGKRYSRECSYWIEDRARRDVYRDLDDEGQYFPEAQLGAGGIWENLPDMLFTDFDVNAALEIITREYPNAVSRISNDAGASYCEYELYSSLAVCHQRRERGRVVFFHIPDDISKPGIDNSTAMSLSLIRALISQLDKDDKVTMQ